MVVIFIGQAIWVASDARKRDEEYWWLWTIAAFIAFPIGIIIYVLVTRSNRSSCGNCGKEVPKKANACPYCGVNYSNTCPNCGEKVEAGWQYCPSCTAKLPVEIASQKKNIKFSGKQKIILGIVIAIVMLLLSLPVINFFIFNKIGHSYEEEVIRTDYFCNQQFEEEHTGTRSYTMSPAIINYEGDIKSGSVVIKSYDSNGNLLQESKTIKARNAEGTFNTGYVGEKVKVTLEFKDFKGEFKMYR